MVSIAPARAEHILGAARRCDRWVGGRQRKRSAVHGRRTSHASAPLPWQARQIPPEPRRLGGLVGRSPALCDAGRGLPEACPAPGRRALLQC